MRLRNRQLFCPPIVLMVFLLAAACVWQPTTASAADSIGEKFHKQTSLTWTEAIADVFRPKPKQPRPFLTIPGTKKIRLPRPKFAGMQLEEAIRKRRSVREFSKRPLSLDDLSQLLFAAQGITGRIYGTPLRTAPSAGALYPMEIYLVVNRVTDLESGLYHYAVRDHALEQMELGDFSGEINAAGLKQEMLGEAGVTFILSAIFDRTRHKYGERGFRYVYMEAGHISQNIALQAVSLGLGSVAVGAFLDEKINRLINNDGVNEAVVYLHAVGKP